MGEYRNGGLFLDSGVLILKDPSWLSQEVNVGTELIVEWRALTVVLLDKLAEDLRKKLQMGEQDLPIPPFWREALGMQAGSLPSYIVLMDHLQFAFAWTALSFEIPMACPCGQD